MVTCDDVVSVDSLNTVRCLDCGAALWSFSPDQLREIWQRPNVLALVRQYSLSGLCLPCQIHRWQDEDDLSGLEL